MELLVLEYLSKQLSNSLEKIYPHRQSYTQPIFLSVFLKHYIFQFHVHIAVKVSLWTCIAHHVVQSEIIFGIYRVYM